MFQAYKMSSIDRCGTSLAQYQNPQNLVRSIDYASDINIRHQITEYRSNILLTTSVCGLDYLRDFSLFTILTSPLALRMLHYDVIDSDPALRRDRTTCA